MFEDQYIALRKKEGRIYSDEELLGLPAIAANHQHYDEWKIRKNSAERLIRALKGKKKQISILEVGCGNGWLSFQLAQISNSEVTGIDINSLELNQACRVFSKQENLKFIAGDLRSDILKENSFDFIVFAASIQYFSPIDELLKTALGHLKESGEIHIIDSFFYTQNELHKAKNRTVKYYNTIGFPQMSSYYFHHSKESLSGFNYLILNKLQMIYSKILRNRPTLPWIMIRKSKSGQS